ncbi:MAG TPA: hypothetical protein VIA11_10955 [Acidimicrobiia bacterium]|nr:hypothetical protein [Acidimicrobiia bacterium]
MSILQPAKVATPEAAAFGFAVHVRVPPPGFVPIVKVIDAELPVTVFPPASCTVTTGCWAHADAAVPPPGCVVNASFAAEPTVMLKVLLVAPVSPPSVAANRYPFPAWSIERPEKVATPLTALTVLVPDSVPVPGFVPMASVTDDVSEVTVFPKASCTVTFGCVPNATPPVELLGCCVNASFDAPAAFTVSCCVADVSPLAAAVTVGVPALASP